MASLASHSCASWIRWFEVAGWYRRNFTVYMFESRRGNTSMQKSKCTLHEKEGTTPAWDTKNRWKIKINQVNQGPRLVRLRTNFGVQSCFTVPLTNPSEILWDKSATADWRKYARKVINKNVYIRQYAFSYPFNFPDSFSFPFTRFVYCSSLPLMLQRW